MRLTSKAMVEFVDRISYDDLPDEVVEKAERFLFDTVGCGVAAFTHPAVKGLRSTFGDHAGGHLSGTVIGSGKTLPLEYTTLINGTMGRYLDFNDCYDAGTSGCHPSDHILPLVSVAEAVDANGRDLLNAIVIAYEVQTRGVESGAMWSNGFDYVTWGGHAAAAATGKLLGLSREELRSAIGMVATSSNGLLASRKGEVSMWKGVAEPYAIHNGVQTCLMANSGITGPGKPFEGEGGVFEGITDAPVDVAPFPPDGAFRVLRSNFKPFASAYVNQSPITAAQELVAENDIAPEDIESIHIRTFARAMHAASEEKWAEDISHETADHSMPYTVAVGIMDGEVTPRQYEEDRLRDPAIHDLMETISVEEDAELTQFQAENLGTTPTVVTMTAEDETHERRLDYPRGHPERPLTDEELSAKVADLVDGYLTDEQFEQVRDACYRLDELDSMAPLVDPLFV
jgi:2-methylcitrate dehydratase